MTEPLEIERKFLIEMPDRTLLDRCPVRWEMWQTYLLSRPGVSARAWASARGPAAGWGKRSSFSTPKSSA